MPGGWQTVRVFISSTFRDMQAERDHLVRFVFPRLRETLAARRLSLVEVDLRWGVTADQNALALCLDEIDRCRPRFLCMLGGRYGWVPPGESSSITAAEIAYGALDAARQPSFCYFYFREDASTGAVPAADAVDFREPAGSPSETALRTLKSRVRAAVDRSPDRRAMVVTDYACVWDAATRRFTGLEAFGAAVYRDILASVEAEFGAAADSAPDDLADERAAMDAFAEARADRYVVGSRQPVIDAMRAHAVGRGGQGLLVVSGDPGSGKSALMAKFWRDIDHPFVLAHFAGASPASTNVRQILRRFCAELDLALGGSTPLPDDSDRLREAFAERLGRLGAQRPVLLLIDAVDQIADSGTPLRWLPADLPTDVRVIASVLPGKTLDALRTRHPAPVEQTLPPLAADDQSAIIDGFLARYRKSIDAAQRAALLAKVEASRPLYLVTALEELRTLGTHEEITARIGELPPTVAALFDWILDRLEKDDGFRDAAHRPIGRSVVAPFATYLACGRVGMTERELAELVAPATAGGAADPLGNVAALQRLLRPYLMRRGALLDFFHGQLRQAVTARYLVEVRSRRQAHRELARYFRACADPAGDGSWTAAHERGLSELPYHQVEGEMWDDVMATLTDLGFLEAKCTCVDVVTSGAGEDRRTTYNGVYALQDDYRRAIERMPSITLAPSPAGPPRTA